MNIGQLIFPDPRDENERNFFDSIQELLKDLRGILNGGILFDENVDCKLVSFTSNASPDTEDAVAHTLGKVPTGYLVYSKDKAGILYDSGTAFTKTDIYVKCNVTSVAFKIIIF